MLRSSCFFYLLGVSLFTFGQQINYSKYVNPFIGTGGHGHTFPGATVPFGFVQLSPDTKTSDWDWCSGYHYSDTTIMGFSHTHLSGTGVGDLGDILIMPYQGKTEVLPADPTEPGKGYHSGFSHEYETASPGYYKVLLNKHNIVAELTTTTHVGVHQYTFPQKTDDAKIIVDVWHGIHSNKPFVNEITIENDSTISGYRYSTGWAETKRIYFVITFSKKFSSRGISMYNKEVRNIPVALSKEPLKAVLGFNVSSGESIMVKVAISANSIENARKNFQEVYGKGFFSIKKDAENSWNKILSKIHVEGDEKFKTIFYTSLYHNFVVPNQITDVNDRTFFGPDLQYHESTVNTYYSSFSLWDTFRATHPLYTILIPDTVSIFINNFIQHHESYGCLPIWPLWGTETHTMIGNHAIPVIYDAYKKGIKGFDVEKAYNAVKQTSIRNHSNCYFDTLDKYHYFPNNRGSQTVSKLLEIAYDDWCAGMMAKDLGYKDDAEYFLTRSKYYINIFDKQSGFMRGKDANGKWTYPFDPAMTSYSGDYTEGNAWQYSFFVPHDINGLIALHGGKDLFYKKLDSLFTITVPLKGDVLDVTGLIGQYAHGNEPSHHISYLFNYAGYSDKTRYYVRRILNEMYNDKPDGLIGNEDCGQMSAWFIFSSLGFYPVNPASGSYDLGIPLFNKAVIYLPGGKKFEITVSGKSGSIKVKSIKLNGKVLDGLHLTHDQILSGGKLEFVVR